MLAVLVLVAAADPSPLAAKLKPVIDAHKGKVCVAVKHLGTGETFAHDADAVVPTASLCKVAVMAEAYHQAEENKLDLGKLLTLTKDDRVPGAGILTDHFSDGAQLSLRDCIRLMIRYSDNTATNMVLDQVGIKSVNDYTAKLGVPETRVHSKVYKRSTSSIDLPRSEKYGLGSTTANETLKLFEMIHAKKLVNETASVAMLAHLKANDDKEMLVRHLPAGTVAAHKTGAVNQVRNDAGILYVPEPADKKKTQPVIVVVLTSENVDQRWVIDNGGQVTIATIGGIVFGHYGAAR